MCFEQAVDETFAPYDMSRSRETKETGQTVATLRD